MDWWGPANSRPNVNRWPSVVLVVAALLVMGVTSSIVIANAAGAASPMVREARLAPPALPRGALSIGGTSKSQSIDLELVLAPSHQAQMASLLHSLYVEGSPDYHQWMSRGEFARRFDPSPTEVAAVESWLAREGLHATYTSGLAVHVSGSAGAIESGMGVSFKDYRLTGGQRVHVASAAPLLPSTVSSTVLSVLGLDNAPRLTSHIVQDHSELDVSPVPHVGGPLSLRDGAAGC